MILMETQCTECGMAHEVGESQQGAYMFCLECDKFFKVEGESEALSSNNGIETTWGAHLKAFSSREKNSIHERIKTAFKKFFGFKEKKVVSDPPKMSETTSDAKTFALIDDFLDPETEFEDEQEDVSAEYIDFLSVGLDVSSSDVIENHGKNKSDELQTCKK